MRVKAAITHQLLCLYKNRKQLAYQVSICSENAVEISVNRQID